MYYQLEYYYDNKDDILKKYSEKIKCPICGLEMRFSSLNPHLDTKKCRYFKKYGEFPKLKKHKHRIKRKEMKPDDFIVTFD